MWKIKQHLPFSSLIFPLKPPYTEAFGRVEKGGRACADVLAEFARGVVKKWRLNDRSGIGNTREKPWKNMVYSLKNHGNTSMKLFHMGLKMVYSLKIAMLTGKTMEN